MYDFNGVVILKVVIDFEGKEEMIVVLEMENIFKLNFGFNEGLLVIYVEK